MDFEKINTGFNQVFKPGKISFGIFFPIEAYQGPVARMTEQVELAQRAEQLGFSALWFRDVPLLDPYFGDAGQVFDPWVYLSFIAAQTSRISLVTGSIILPLRHPVHVAKAAASVDHLSKGRLILGVGTGDRPGEYRAFGIDPTLRQVLFRQSFHHISSLWNEFPNVESGYGRMEGDLDLIPKPYAGKIPLLVTGKSGQDIDWIARHADGWIYYPRNPMEQKEIVALFRSRLNALGIRDKPFAQSLYIDLSENINESPLPIHLGYRCGINALSSIIEHLCQVGVNHIVFNLKYAQRSAGDILEELGDLVKRSAFVN